MAEGVSSYLIMCLLFLLTICTPEVSPLKQFQQKELKREEQIFHYSHRQLLHDFHYKTTQHDTLNPPTTTLPTTPVAISPENNPVPTIVTVPATTPDSTPFTVPSTNPLNPPVQITNPVTTPGTVPGAQPVTNPVTTYPAPSTGVPATTPVTNPVPPPATTGSPATVPGQSWCVAKSGSPESSLQAALDYACGIGGADCSGIQQGSSCYNPNSLQNHASYAFNSYYQKNPVQTSCDFGGTATITNINPSTGTCIYQSSSSSPLTPTPTTPPTPVTTTPTTPSPVTTTPTPTLPSPMTTTPAPPTTTPTPTPPTSSSGATMPFFSSPPAMLNTTNPASGSTTVFGDNPPSFNSSTSMATILQPFTGFVILVIAVVTGKFTIDK